MVLQNFRASLGLMISSSVSQNSSPARSLLYYAKVNSIIPPLSTVCREDGWIRYGNSRYLIINIPTLKWSDARRTCQIFGGDLVSLAAVFSIVTQRSSPQTAAHIRTTFLSTTLTNHHVVYIFRELGAPK